jgi:hypothetical protein
LEKIPDCIRKTWKNPGKTGKIQDFLKNVPKNRTK